MSASMLTGSLVVDGEVVPCKVTRVTMDESWSPYVQASVTIPWTPERASALAPTVADPPRAVLHLTRSWGAPGVVADLTAAWAGLTVADLTAAWAGLTVADLTAAWADAWTDPPIESQRTVLDLTIRNAVADVRAATITLALMSDEALAQDQRIFSTVLSTGTRARVIELMAHAGLTIADADLACVPDQPLTPEFIFPTSSIWDLVSTMLGKLGVRLWCDEARRWHTSTTAVTTPGTTTLTGVTDLTTTSDRDGSWAQVLAMVYTARVTVDGVTDDRTYVWVQPDTPPATPARWAVVTQDVGEVPSSLWPPDDSYLEAQARYARLASLATTASITAVADLTVRPGTVVATADPLPIVSGVASNVTWAIPDDTVTITTRTEV